ncbi:leucine zipper domain-containing protein [Streptomyces sp. NBC_01635]|uniref:Leucine zipper domain-containing protein n=1 Tax=Streptomyces hirsutus TaxID=35620 RepID=A0ABZ1H2I7_9ACTN|nr:leucine zipper domain-containing protein [Streptomyces hirsutus]WSD11586.1 leucine zipper domain-containing protein [Streptomyces hirsutus]WTD79990.1 leucine zipper domain-containing protein [Streptomyces sp. NBC_01635]
MSRRNARSTFFGRLLLVERVVSGRPAAHVAAGTGVSRTTAHPCMRRWRADGRGSPARVRPPGRSGRRGDLPPSCQELFPFPTALSRRREAAPPGPPHPSQPCAEPCPGYVSTPGTRARAVSSRRRSRAGVGATAVASSAEPSASGARTQCPSTGSPRRTAAGGTSSPGSTRRSWPVARWPPRTAGPSQAGVGAP